MAKAQRRYPDIFIVGAARCGTTFLYSALAAHPSVRMSAKKEPHFLAPDLDPGDRINATHRVRDEDAYLRLFRHARPGQLLGEASATYLVSNRAPVLIAHLAPEARIVVALRDPVDQIASMHAFRYGKGWEDLPLAEAIDAEEERAAGRRLPARPVMPVFLRYRHVARFGEQLERLFAAIPMARVRVLYLDELAADPHRTWRGLTRWLGLDDDDLPAGLDRNVAKQPRSRRLHAAMASWRTIGAAKRLTPRALHPVAGAVARRAFRLNRRAAPRPSMPPGVRDRLRDELGPDLARASSMLGEDLAARWWRDP